MILTIKDGKLVKVEGDPEHPISQGRLCPRCLALVEFENHPDRVRYPMKRAKEDRGLDTWERITWEEALDIIEEEVHKIWDNYGPESIFVSQGTGRAGKAVRAALAQRVLQISQHIVHDERFFLLRPSYRGRRLLAGSRVSRTGLRPVLREAL